MAFLLSVASSTAFIWNGKDKFVRKDWLLFAFKFFIAMAGAIVFGFMLKAMVSAGLSLSIQEGKTLTAQVCLSLVCIFGLKFLVVALCAMFSEVMGFHQQHNTKENYEVLSSISNRTAPFLLVSFKVVMTLASLLIYYGIWPGMAVK
jgi:hypothetical protein